MGKAQLWLLFFRKDAGEQTRNMISGRVTQSFVNKSVGLPSEGVLTDQGVPRGLFVVSRLALFMVILIPGSAFGLFHPMNANSIYSVCLASFYNICICKTCSGSLSSETVCVSTCVCACARMCVHLHVSVCVRVRVCTCRRFHSSNNSTHSISLLQFFFV